MNETSWVPFLMMLGILLPFGLAFGWIGSAIGTPRGHSTAGVLLGLFLGPIGWIITAVLPRTPEAEAKFQQRVNRAMTGHKRTSWK